ncbi:uncharacterized protein LOC111372751 isoform X3 [Olea europaea var. sylvestris]|uniref:uncharacterized protein LOC111372751 isoform X3 n=1 Tax=Olea europaea var. sylvestris TaxID=158386 RepID=UPI000C1D831D|nr:uncharacterized protein LOC111372751 isoform X3 [Olea europaea var. sylvestris]
MALQWMILAYVVAAEAGVAILLTLPSPKALKSRIVSLISLILQPSLFVVPFSAFQLLDLQGSEECSFVCFSLPSVLVYLPYLQVSQGYSEHGGSREEVQGALEDSVA